MFQIHPMLLLAAGIIAWTCSTGPAQADDWQQATERAGQVRQLSAELSKLVYDHFRHQSCFRHLANEAYEMHRLADQLEQSLAERQPGPHWPDILTELDERQARVACLVDSMMQAKNRPPPAFQEPSSCMPLAQLSAVVKSLARSIGQLRKQLESLEPKP